MLRQKVRQHPAVAEPLARKRVQLHGERLIRGRAHDRNALPEAARD